LRIDPALKEAAARAAASDRRSLTAYIEKLIEDDIRMRESSSPRKPKKGQAA